jgi:hypothetical protein
LFQAVIYSGWGDEQQGAAAKVPTTDKNLGGWATKFVLEIDQATSVQAQASQKKPWVLSHYCIMCTEYMITG